MTEGITSTPKERQLSRGEFIRLLSLSLFGFLAGCSAPLGKEPEKSIKGVIPTSGVIMTTHNQYLRGFEFHNGYDIQNEVGTEVVSAFDGKVLSVDDYQHTIGSLGKNIIVKLAGTRLYCTVTYGHLNDFSVHEGQEIKIGQPVGHMGNTGLNKNFPPHLHIEGQSEGYRFDLADYIPKLKGVNLGDKVLSQE